MVNCPPFKANCQRVGIWQAPIQDWLGCTPIQGAVLDRLGQMGLFDLLAAGQILVGDPGDFDVQVDAVEQGAGGSGAVALQQRPGFENLLQVSQFTENSAQNRNSPVWKS